MVGKIHMQENLAPIACLIKAGEGIARGSPALPIQQDMPIALADQRGMVEIKREGALGASRQNRCGQGYACDVS
jgi:hypothetical protein